ncbi:uncharacterized protein LAESUDRAFT_808837 [Laetiporus sulphureus 93-53]|uniref:Uncharacterized protein n=1 Tax=Laetiporus sulphureus 93-53 TaxID=1314785 RepID=A0A165HLR7_9APHY|nr:uncharacterized protein LAESUDRAFT_808837 [Laetiporus sulphureus 93-53]KZT11900.1 hypothetical protein LAESUDRAFT_808837 [Laetiporus sulphureus 93-53]
MHTPHLQQSTGIVSAGWQIASQAGMAPADEDPTSSKHDVSSAVEQPDSPQMEIVDEGYLVRRVGINPETGEAWNTSWVRRNNCSAEAIAKWEANKPGIEPADESLIDGSSNIRKRSISSIVSIANATTKRRELNNESMPVTKPGSSSEGQNLHSSKGPGQQLPDFIDLRKSRRASSLFIPSPRKGSKYQFKTSVHQVEISQISQSNTDTFEVTTEWLLDRVVSTQKGMLVELRGTNSGKTGDGWYHGQYEGAQGMILSVLNTGHTSFASTARVKLLDLSDSPQEVFTVPVSYLWPVEPTEPGQRALMLHGDQKGSVAIVREEESDGWFVSVGNLHFGISANKLVRVINA